MTVVAHAGHWLVSLIYVAPVLAVAAWLGLEVLRDRRRRAGGRSSEAEDRPGALD